MGLALLAFWLRRDLNGSISRLAIALDLPAAEAHHRSRVGEGYLRRLSRVPYLLTALHSLGEPDA